MEGDPEPAATAKRPESEQNVRTNPEVEANMRRIPRIALAAAAAGGALLVAQHVRRGPFGRSVPGGIVMEDAAGYDAGAARLLRGFYRSVAADVAKTAGPDGRVLEVGCGPGRLAIALAREFGLDVTGLDLDPAMIDRANANADRSGGRRPAFVVGDVASLPFPDASFDVAVSTLSMHHWDDATAGLTEIARVLRTDGHALVWDVRPGFVPLHAGLPDPVARMHDAPLRVTSVTHWRWPWKLSFTERIEAQPVPANG